MVNKNHESSCTKVFGKNPLTQPPKNSLLSKAICLDRVSLNAYCVYELRKIHIEFVKQGSIQEVIC